MEKNPHVSVVMNTYKNNHEHLRQAILSYIKQEKVKIQLIISTVKGDTAIAIAEELGVKDIVISSKPGIYEQLNKGLELVKGDWYCFAFGNDTAEPGKCYTEISMCFLTGKKVCYSAFYCTDEKLENKKLRKWYPYDYKKHLTIGNFVNDCAMVSRDILDKYKPFVLKYGNMAYYDFWLRIYEGEGDVFVYNPVAAWNYRYSNDSRHIKRKKSPAQIKKNNDLRILMLSEHAKNL